MINFVNGSADRTYQYHGDWFVHAGMLATPKSGNSVRIAANLKMPWALDNGCYTKYDPAGIMRMLNRFRGVRGCKFAVIPDVICDHDATLLMFRAWVGTYRRLSYPVAFVLQNGVTVDAVPWDSVDAVFIGGDTTFKYSQVVREIVVKAKLHRKWVHMGRVNSARRIQYAKSIGCDSFDGTGFSIAPRQRIAELLPAYTNGRQMNLWEVQSCG